MAAQLHPEMALARGDASPVVDRCRQLPDQLRDRQPAGRGDFVTGTDGVLVFLASTW
jgi:hypothetical protein